MADDNDTTPCPEYRPDQNGECLNCDEPADEHRDFLRAEVERLRAVERAYDALRDHMAAEKRCDFLEHLELMVDLSTARAEITRLRALVDAVGEKVCELALRQQKKLHDQPFDK